MFARQRQWDGRMGAENQAMHLVAFQDAQQAFSYLRRVISSGYWRKGKSVYEKENRLHG